MKPLKITVLGLALFLAGLNRVLAATDWSVDMSVSEACCCNSLCPCLFNSPPTLGHCHVNWLAEIEKGRYGGLKLDGLSVVCVEEMGKWRKYYVTEKATKEQAEALAALIGGLPLFEVKEVRGVERVPIEVHKKGRTIAFSTPASEDEIELMKGVDGKEIKVLNLPLEDVVAYQAIKHTHHSKDTKFDYKGTHGATYRVRATSKDAQPAAP